METIKLVHGLTEAMYESLGQALIIYLLARLIIFLLPWMDSVFRYRVLYFSLTMSFLLFAGRLYLLYSDSAHVAASGNAAPLQEAQARIFDFKSTVHRYAFEIGAVYVLGVILQLILFVTSFFKIQWYKNRRYLHHNELWQMKLEALMKNLGITRKVKLFFSERVSGPFTIGWLKPVVFFPVAALTSLSPEQIEAILVHELAHIKRNDYLWNLLQRVMEMFMFFNPVTWVLASEIKKEREYCCDDVVLKQNQVTVSYARALFLLERERTGYNLLMQASGGQKNSLLERIKRLTDMETSKSTGLPKAVVFTGLMAAVLFVGWVKPSEDAKKTLIKTQEKSINTASDNRTGRSRINVVTSSSKKGKNCSLASLADTSLPVAPVDPVASVSPVTPVAPVVPVLPVEPVAPVAPDSVAESVNRYFKSPEWKQQVEAIKKQSEDIKKYFNGPQWKQQMEDIKKQSLELQKYFSSPEWKQQVAKIKVDAEAMKKYYDSPQWKQQVESMKHHAEEISRQFDSPEWKKKVAELQDKSIKMQKKAEEQLKKAEEQRRETDEKL